MSGCKPWKNPLVGQLRSQDKELLVKTFTSIEKWSHQFGACAGGSNVETWCDNWDMTEGTFNVKSVSLSGKQIGPYDDMVSVHLTIDTNISVAATDWGAFDTSTAMKNQDGWDADIGGSCLAAGRSGTSRTRLIGLQPGGYIRFIGASASYYAGAIPSGTSWSAHQDVSAIIVHGTDAGCFEWNMPG